MLICELGKDFWKEQNNKLMEYWTHMLKILNLNWISRIYNEPHGPGASFKSQYCSGRIPTTPTVGASSRRVKLRNTSVNCMQCMLFILVRDAIWELRNVVFEYHMKNSLLFQH